MKGALHHYLQKAIIINSILWLMILCFEFLLQGGLFAHPTFKEFIINIKYYFNNSQYSDKYILLAITVNIYLIIWLIRYFKELNLPYAINLFQDIRQPQGYEKRNISIHDKFKNKKTYHNGFSLFYNNWISVNIENYENYKKVILQYIGIKGDIKVSQWGRKGVELRFYTLPNNYIADKNEYQKGFIHYGVTLDHNYYMNIGGQTHLLCVGESGSGKSNLMHYILKSIFINSQSFENLYLIDLKGPELYRYKDSLNVHFIDQIQDVNDMLENLKNEMNRRFEIMKQENVQIYKGKFHFVFIDEIGTIGTHHDKKTRDKIFANMIELFQKGRAAKIIFFVFAQKIDSTNIPSNVLANIPTKVLMKTDSDFNINNTIGTKENLEKITLIDPDSFPKGRAIIKDGVTSEKTLIQVPFVKL